MYRFLQVSIPEVEYSIFDKLGFVKTPGIVQAVCERGGPFCEESVKIWEQGQFCMKNLTRRGAHPKKIFLQHHATYLQHRLVKILHIGFWLYNLLH